MVSYTTTALLLAIGLATQKHVVAGELTSQQEAATETSLPASVCEDSDGCEDSENVKKYLEEHYNATATADKKAEIKKTVLESIAAIKNLLQQQKLDLLPENGSDEVPEDKTQEKNVEKKEKGSYFASPPASAQEKSIFEILDTNGDYKMSKEELRAFFTEKGTADLLANEDKNGDGYVSWEEFNGPKGNGPPTDKVVDSKTDDIKDALLQSISAVKDLLQQQNIHPSEAAEEKDGNGKDADMSSLMQSIADMKNILTRRDLLPSEGGQIISSDIGSSHTNAPPLQEKDAEKKKKDSDFASPPAPAQENIVVENDVLPEEDIKEEGGADNTETPLQEEKSLFEMLDTNGDFKLTKEEARKFFFSELGIARFMESEDRDGDGYVTWEEFHGDKVNRPPLDEVKGENDEDIIDLDDVPVSGQLDEESSIEFLPGTLRIPRESNLSLQDYYEKYVDTETPVIIEDYADAFKGMSAENIYALCGEKNVTIAHISHEDNAWANIGHYSHATLSEAMTQVSMQSLSSSVESFDPIPGSVYGVFDWSLQFHCPELLEEHMIVPKYLAQDFLQRIPHNISNTYRDAWPSLFVAVDGTYGSNHRDAFKSAFWMYVIEGAKEWQVIDGVDDYDFFDPKAPHPRHYQDVVGKGQLIIIPGNRWHQVRNRDKTLTLAGNFVTRSNYAEVEREVKGHLSAENGEKKYKELKAMFDPDFDTSIDYDQGDMTWKEFRDQGLPADALRAAAEKVNDDTDLIYVVDSLSDKLKGLMESIEKKFPRK